MTISRETESEPVSIALPSAGHEWVVAHVRPRCEKKLALACEQAAVPCYLPLKKKTHRYGKRRRDFHSPLFPGYVFCLVDSRQVSVLKQNRYVANLLKVLDQETLVQQLRRIRHALSVDDALEVMPYLEKGKPVRVTAGPFKGLEGHVHHIKGRTRVVINVDMIQKSVYIEVDHGMLEVG